MGSPHRNISILISVSAEDISCIDFLFDIVEGGIIAVGNDAAAHILEFLQAVDDLGAKESRSVLERGLINDNGSTLGLNALHNALDGGLPEVVGICFHGKAVHTDNDVFLLTLFSLE